MLRNCVLVALLVYATPQATASQDTTAPSVVGIFSTNGLLLPLAVWSGSDWSSLPWPMRQTLGSDDQKLPPIPGTVATIPQAWVRPLDSFPTSWRAHLLNAGIRTLGLNSPTGWENAAVESIAIGVDYKGADTDSQCNFDAGIAVTGDVTTLSVRHLTHTAPEWHSIVDQHLVAFDRAQRMPWASGRTRSRAAFRRWLLQSEVDLWKVTDSNGAFFYFEVTDGALLKGPCPAAQALEGRIEAPTRGPSSVIHIQPVTMSCGDMNEGIEVIGAVTYHGTTRLVIRSGGEGGMGYQVVDPKVPLTWRQF